MHGLEGPKVLLGIPACFVLPSFVYCYFIEGALFCSANLIEAFTVFIILCIG